MTSLCRPSWVTCFIGIKEEVNEVYDWVNNQNQRCNSHQIQIRVTKMRLLRERVIVLCNVFCDLDNNPYQVIWKMKTQSVTFYLQCQWWLQVLDGNDIF